MATYRFWPGTTPGTGSYALASEYYSKGLEFYAVAPTWVLGVHQYQYSGSTTGVAALFQITAANGSTATEVANTRMTITNGGANAWKYQAFTGPIRLAENTRYKLVVYFANTRYTYGLNYWTTGGGANGIKAGPAFAPSAADASGGTQGTSRYTSTNAGIGYPLPTTATSGEWIGFDIQISDTDPTGQMATHFQQCAPQF